MNIKCFMVEPTDQQFQWLRRFVCSGESNSRCPGNKGYHDAMVRIEDAPFVGDRNWDRDDKRWPAKCDSCDYQFGPDDEWQLFALRQFKRADTGEISSIHPIVLPPPVGAMWFATWLEDVHSWRGPDGKVLVVQTPGGAWIVDGRASNCDMPDDNEHKCWVRHGSVPDITVDKNGNTCHAGGGSIGIGKYHGFLRNGFLVDA